MFGRFCDLDDGYVLQCLDVICLLTVAWSGVGVH
jgi:hypothetical protein